MISSPTLLLDEAKCRANIERMAAKARENKMSLRPHFKTHQSSDVAQWIREAGITKCTVSSIRMAAYFQEAGWDDITIAFPVNIREWDLVSHLAGRGDINITITSPHVVETLLTLDVPKSVGYFIKIDVGTHRTGFRHVEVKEIEYVLSNLPADRFKFRGFLCHAGHSYACRSEAEVQKVHEEACQIMLNVQSKFKGFGEAIISMGDTPTASLAKGWEGIDELRAGNFVFYDLTQWQIGSCNLNDIAVCMAAPVVAKHPHRNNIIVYGGGVHLSKDRMILNDSTIFGLPVFLDGDMSWTQPDFDSQVVSVSQEHGVINASKKMMDQIQVGDLLGILPVHSCLAADLMKQYQLCAGGQALMLK